MTLLTTDAAMYALAPEWAELWSRTNATPFQHPAWLLPWWSAFGTGLQRVAILRDGDRLIGVLPLYERLDEAKLFPMGAGITDYQDVLLDPLAPPDAAEMLLATALRDTALPAHLIDLPPWSPLRDCGTDRNSTLSPADPCPVLDPTRISARQLRKLRMSRDRANRAGGATIQIATPATAVRMFADLSDLYALRWRERGKPALSSNLSALCCCAGFSWAVRSRCSWPSSRMSPDSDSRTPRARRMRSTSS